MAEAEEKHERIIYRCHNCRVPLFTSDSIIPHKAEKVRKFLYKREYGTDQCTSFFIQQPRWLDATGRMRDIIYCPKCNYKLGHFSWKGLQCSCGEWVVPAFQIPMSRVDDV